MKNKLRVVIIVQARMGSTRLPKKVLKEVLDKPLLQYLIERLKKVQFQDEIVIATTVNPEDQEIVEFCHMEEVPLFRGKSEDVLDRFYHAAKAFKADVVVRITADCPLIDPKLVDQAIDHFIKHYPNYDYVSNSNLRTLPIGMDVEVFSFKALEEAFNESTLPEEREHVTPFIYRRKSRYTTDLLTHEPNLSNYRLTVDTKEDFELVQKILETLYPKNKNFTMEDIIHLLSLDHPEWMKINADVKHRDIR